jgi:hypothetical protein
MLGGIKYACRNLYLANTIAAPATWWRLPYDTSASAVGGVTRLTCWRPPRCQPLPKLSAGQAFRSWGFIFNCDSGFHRSCRPFGYIYKQGMRNCVDRIRQEKAQCCLRGLLGPVQSLPSPMAGWAGHFFVA